MEKINSKEQKESPRNRHLFWINYYGSKNFGIWVECTKCKKWRKTFQYSESHEVPESWHCSMLTLESGEKGSCNDPEEENHEPYLDYCPGSIVWAKLEGYPWWPSMVDGDPDTDEYLYREYDGTLHYNVTFLDEKPTHAWIPEVFICPFSESPKVKKGHLEKLRQKRYAKAISEAKKRAKAAMKMTIKDRLQTYSFVHSYKGKWPTTSNLEECDIEKNGSRNTEDKADIVLKKPDKLRSSDSTSSSNAKYDKTLEKDFSQKENNTAEGENLISRNPVFPRLEKKACNKKLLNKKNCMTENEGLSFFKKKKNLNHSASVNKALRNDLVECAKSITVPVREKEAEGIKRKANRKFTHRKKKNLDNPTRRLIDAAINLKRTNSEYGNDENLNAVSVTKVGSRKEDDSRSIHVSEERSTIENYQNGLFEIPNYEKCGLEKLTNNVNHLDKKELKKNTCLLECAGNTIDPVEEKEVIGKKRKVNRKFTPSKEKKFESPSQNLTDGIIDLGSTNFEYESDENLNAVTFLKDVGRSICALKKGYITESNEDGLNKVSHYEKHSAEKQTNSVKPLNKKSTKKVTNIFTDKTTHSLHLSSDEEMSEHTHEAVLEFNENQNLEKLDKYNNLNGKKIRTSNELPQKSSKEKKSHDSLEYIIQSSSKITKSEENIIQISKIPPETKVLPDVGNSTSKINKQMITEVPEFMKRSQKNVKPKDSKLNLFKKQPASSFSVPVKNSAGRNDEILVDKRQKCEEKNIQSTTQNPEKIIILL